MGVGLKSAKGLLLFRGSAYCPVIWLVSRGQKLSFWGLAFLVCFFGGVKDRLFFKIVENKAKSNQHPATKKSVGVYPTMPCFSHVSADQVMDIFFDDFVPFRKAKGKCLEPKMQFFFY